MPKETLSVRSRPGPSADRPSRGFEDKFEAADRLIRNGTSLVRRESRRHMDTGEAVDRHELRAQLFSDIQTMHGRLKGNSLRLTELPNVILNIDVIVEKLPVSVGGDGLDSPRRGSLRLIT